MLSWFPEFWSLLLTFKNIEGHFALVSNLEQPITTLKSRMELSRPTHKAAVLALPPFERKHLAKTATIILAGSK
jgi:hypothetical protein